MQTHFIKKGTLVVLVGPSGSGKSTFCKKYFDPSMVVSSDALREQILGFRPWLPGATYSPRAAADVRAVFPIMEQTVKIKLAAGQTTVVDATCLMQGDRLLWEKIATSMDRDFLAIFFELPVEQLIENNKNRDFAVPDEVLQAQINCYDKTKTARSALSTDNFVLMENMLPHNHFDVVGDIHGLMDDFKKLMEKMGWDTQSWTHRSDPQRMILFLGDIVDRGPDSVALLDLVMKLVKEKKALMVCGNHEKKLTKFIEAAFIKKVGAWNSYSNAETGCNLFRTKSEEEIRKILSFLKALPWYYVCADNECAFLHGDVKQFDTNILYATAVYGESEYGKPSSNDSAYQWSYEQGLSSHTLFRGHIQQTSIENNVFSLEDAAFEKGNLVAVPLDALKAHACWGGAQQREAFDAVVVKQACDFEFSGNHSLFQYGPLRALRHLVKEQLAFTSEDETGLLNVFKYSKRVFYDHRWGDSDWLLKARGIVFEKGGRIASHPFDKCYNYLEENAGADVPDEEPVYKIDKLNGFLGIVSKNPFRPGLLIHTQGSFEGEPVDMLKSHLKGDKIGRLMRFFNKNAVTLMFEVLDEKDPHIISYPRDMMGLHLIGVRGLNLEDEPWSEERVDEVAKELGFPRPIWVKTTFKQAIEEAKASLGEGAMIRRQSDNKFICKCKSKYYLSTKFVARLTEKKIKHMYKSTEDFKQQVDEEFYILVDEVVSTIVQEEFLGMSEQTRILKVNEILDKLKDLKKV